VLRDAMLRDAMCAARCLHDACDDACDAMCLHDALEADEDEHAVDGRLGDAREQRGPQQRQPDEEVDQEGRHAVLGDAHAVVGGAALERERADELRRVRQRAGDEGQAEGGAERVEDAHQQE
jgi:hypothetical protein